MRHLKPLLMLSALLLSTAAHADQVTAPVTIEADQLELNQQSGVSHYRGNVRLQQGGIELRADRLELHTVNGRIQRAMADGKPVQLEQRAEKSSQPIRAEAQHVEYRLDDGMLELTGDAHLWRGNDEFSGKRLLYDSRLRSVKAYGNGEGSSRVRVILQPQGDAGDE